MKNIARVLFLSVAASSAVVGAQMTVGDLQKLCTSSDEGDKVACTFYILGVTEGTSLASNSVKDSSGEFREIKNKPICTLKVFRGRLSNSCKDEHRRGLDGLPG